MKTQRQKIVELLTNNEMCIEEIRLALGNANSDLVKDDLKHIAKSHKVKTTRAVCNTCQFKFKENYVFKTPSRCPNCKGMDIKQQRLQIK